MHKCACLARTRHAVLGVAFLVGGAPRDTVGRRFVCLDIRFAHFLALGCCELLFGAACAVSHCECASAWRQPRSHTSIFQTTVRQASREHSVRSLGAAVGMSWTLVLTQDPRLWRAFLHFGVRTYRHRKKSSLHQDRRRRARQASRHSSSRPSLPWRQSRRARSQGRPGEQSLVDGTSHQFPQRSGGVWWYL